MVVNQVPDSLPNRLLNWALDNSNNLLVGACNKTKENVPEIAQPHVDFDCPEDLMENYRPAKTFECVHQECGDEPNDPECLCNAPTTLQLLDPKERF